MKKPDVVFAWSCGKDSAMGLYELLSRGEHNVVSLLTTVTADYGRVSMHGVRRELLHAQADSLGLPLVEVSITKDADNSEYERKMEAAMLGFKEKGVDLVAFADLFLEDVRRYREDNLAKVGMRALFPIWKKPTGQLAQEFIGLGFKAVITCVDTKKLGREFAGRDFDQSFIADLPESADPCGENGEFHTFVHDGPIFKTPIAFKRGETVLRDGRFCFHDLEPFEY